MLARLPAMRDSGDQAVSVLIVSWNTHDLLARCLSSFSPGAFDVVVVDNASADGSAEMVAARFPWVTLVAEPLNLGFAGGVNRAASHARGDLLLLLNADAVPDARAIAALAEALDRDSACVAAGGLLVGEEGESQDGFHVRRFPTLATWVVDLLLVDKLWPRNPITRRYLAVDLDLSGPGPVEVDQPAAACLMVRRTAFEAIGGMDSAFFPAWFEDVDLCLRLKGAGGRIVTVPSARFRHQGGVAMRHLGLAGFTRVWYHNLERYVLKHQGAASLVLVKAMIVAGMLLRAMTSVAGGAPGRAAAYLGVLRPTLTSWPSLR
jgi:GT2 family glycosyltransferase